MHLYIDYLEAIKNLMNFLTFMFKKIPRGNIFVLDYFVEKFPEIFKTQITILKNMPQVGTLNIRKEILSYMKLELNDISTYEKADKL